MRPLQAERETALRDRGAGKNCLAWGLRNEQRRPYSLTGLMLAEVIVQTARAVLGIYQLQNVEHGLLPLPALRDSGRCRMLGIRTGGVRHPSSE
jgi:hypothetical protein